MISLSKIINNINKAQRSEAVNLIKSIRDKS
jgi:hypothetical protein